MAVSATARRTSFDLYFRTLASAPERSLVLDYDGTLAPFRKERAEATPYPEVSQILDRIAAQPQASVTIVSGRPAAEVSRLVGMGQPIEIWGSHGMERLLPSGEYQFHQLSARTVQDLKDAAQQLSEAGLQEQMEIKPGAIAIHWRGLDQDFAQRVHVQAWRILNSIAFRSGLLLSPFDGGIEIRVRNPNKGDVMQAIVKRKPNSRIAYLGDDSTDEDAFRALGSYGLSVLVRDEYRATAAQAWLRPPDELVRFLRNWLRACGGEYEQE